jgi:hypothetical protein
MMDAGPEGVTVVSVLVPVLSVWFPSTFLSFPELQEPSSRTPAAILIVAKSLSCFSWFLFFNGKRSQGAGTILQMRRDRR